MLISKFDLYKREWLELVFDDRNKNYGAYELRQQNSRTMLTSMAIAFSTIGAAALILGVVVKPVVKAIPAVRIIPVSILRVITPPPTQPPSHAMHNHSITPPAARAAANPILVIVPTPNPVVVTPIKPTTITADDPGAINIPGPANGINDGPSASVPGSGSGSTVPVTDFESLERMPQPVGGASAWSKFLTKHIVYPSMAVDQHAQGAVWVSFIIEADGKLSNFKVLRGPGYGMDEEALRVLKMAPAWLPGMQNGHPVRVAYNIPIRFTLTDDNN